MIRTVKSAVDTKESSSSSVVEDFRCQLAENTRIVRTLELKIFPYKFFIMAFKLWERISQADNVFQALRPLTYISLLGLAPFRLNLNPRKEVQTSTYSFIAGIVHFLFFVMCFGISLVEGDSIIGYFFQTNITRLGDGTLRLTGILAMSTIFGFAMFKRQRLVSIIQNNIVVDEIFVRLGMKLDYRRILLSSFLISLGMLLFNVIYLCVSYGLLVSATISPSFETFTTFALPHINISLMVFKFLCTTDLARSRFSMLNEVSVGGSLSQLSQ